MCWKIVRVLFGCTRKRKKLVGPLFNSQLWRCMCVGLGGVGVILEGGFSSETNPPTHWRPCTTFSFSTDSSLSLILLEEQQTNPSSLCLPFPLFLSPHRSLPPRKSTIPFCFCFPLLGNPIHTFLNSKGPFLLLLGGD